MTEETDNLARFGNNLITTIKQYDLTDKIEDRAVITAGFLLAKDELTETRVDIGEKYHFENDISVVDTTEPVLCDLHHMESSGMESMFNSRICGFWYFSQNKCNEKLVTALESSINGIVSQQFEYSNENVRIYPGDEFVTITGDATLRIEKGENESLFNRIQAGKLVGYKKRFYILWNLYPYVAEITYDLIDDNKKVDIRPGKGLMQSSRNPVDNTGDYDPKLVASYQRGLIDRVKEMNKNIEEVIIKKASEVSDEVTPENRGVDSAKLDIILYLLTEQEKLKPRIEKIEKQTTGLYKMFQAGRFKIVEAKIRKKRRKQAIPDVFHKIGGNLKKYTRVARDRFHEKRAKSKEREKSEVDTDVILPPTAGDELEEVTKRINKKLQDDGSKAESKNDR